MPVQYPTAVFVELVALSCKKSMTLLQLLALHFARIFVKSFSFLDFDIVFIPEVCNLFCHSMTYVSMRTHVLILTYNYNIISQDYRRKVSNLYCDNYLFIANVAVCSSTSNPSDISNLTRSTQFGQ